MLSLKDFVSISYKLQRNLSFGVDFHLRCSDLHNAAQAASGNAMVVTPSLWFKPGRARRYCLVFLVQC
jgi:hypothetical protein